MTKKTTPSVDEKQDDLKGGTVEVTEEALIPPTESTESTPPVVEEDVSVEEPAEPVPEEETGDAESPGMLFRQRIATDYPDLDVNDDEAYYANANERYDELKGLRDNVSKFRDALDLDGEGSGLFNEMIVEAANNPQFDPVVFLVEHGVDIDEALQDPDYAKKLADARAKYLSEVSEGEEINRQFEENAPKAMEAINSYCEENGISDDEKNEVIGKMYDIMDSLIVGNMPLDLFEFALNGQNHDSDVDEARLAGEAEGRSAKVNQKLRKLKDNDRISGRQAPTAESAPSGGEAPNMFGL